MSNQDIDKVVKAFRCRNTKILISQFMNRIANSIGNISFVINYNMPATKAEYIFRVGLREKFPSRSRVINFADSTGVEMVKELQSYYNTTIHELPLDWSEI